VTSEPAASDRRDEDRALLAAHVAGDDGAFGVLFARHRDRLWAVALRTTGNPEDAADALQEAMIAAFRRAESFRGEAAVSTWLHRIVVNASLDRIRRRTVRAADPWEEEDGLGDRPSSSPVDDPEAHALAGDLRRRVLDALAQLPPEQRAALVLVDMEGYPVQEAATVLEVPVGTVKSRCARGRQRLAELLGDVLDERPPVGGTHRPPAASKSSAPVSGPVSGPVPGPMRGGRGTARHGQNPGGGDR
jgi:RNA polymerase sigma-70 factor (ECF subfamily)